MDFINGIIMGSKSLINFIGSLPNIIIQCLANFPPEMAGFLVVAFGIFVAFVILRLVL